MSETNKKPVMEAFVTTKSGDKTFYHKIGAAWKTKNGGYSVKLHATPTDGEMVLFPIKEKKQ